MDASESIEQLKARAVAIEASRLRSHNQPEQGDGKSKKKRWCNVCKKNNHSTDQCRSAKKKSNENTAGNAKNTKKDDKKQVSAVGSESRWFLNVKFGNRECDALVDCGSTASFIPQDFAPDVKPVKRSFFSYNQTEVNVMGTTDVNITVAGREFRHHFM